PVTELAVGQHGPIHVPASDFTRAPSPEAKYLLLLLDPDDKIAENDKTNNVASVPYASTMTVTAKYDGDPDSRIMGRYFSGTKALADNTFTVTLADSLDALRPAVEIKIGSQALEATISATDT